MCQVNILTKSNNNFSGNQKSHRKRVFSFIDSILDFYFFIQTQYLNRNYYCYYYLCNHPFFSFFSTCRINCYKPFPYITQCSWVHGRKWQKAGTKLGSQIIMYNFWYCVANKKHLFNDELLWWWSQQLKWRIKKKWKHTCIQRTENNRIITIKWKHDFQMKKKKKL